MRKCKCIKSANYDTFISGVNYYYFKPKGLEYSIFVSQFPMTLFYFNEHFIDIVEARDNKIILILSENGKM